MRITPITREQNSVPVFKNIVYGLRLGFKCDKNLFLAFTNYGKHFFNVSSKHFVFENLA